MITLKNIVLRRGTKVLLDNVSVTLNPGEKSVLWGAMAQANPPCLPCSMARCTKTAAISPFPSNGAWPRWRRTCRNRRNRHGLRSGGRHRLAELHAQRLQLENSDASYDDPEHGMAIAQVYTDLADAGDHDAEPRAQALILGLGFQAHELDRPVNSFSGGWRMRLQLARALMCPSDLLLLDEPTNHLDLDALVWLEAWLKKYAGTMIVISHDREFLDAVTNVTLQIDSAKLTRYGGNYSKFEELRAQQMELQQAAYAKQQDKIAHLQKFIDRFKAKASKAKQAQSRVKALERMERVAPLLAEAEFTFEFKGTGQPAQPHAGHQRCFVWLPDRRRHQNHSARRQPLGSGWQRIGILGANGQGKSTLVKPSPAKWRRWLAR